jgi:hypothetical protein
MAKQEQIAAPEPVDEMTRLQREINELKARVFQLEEELAAKSPHLRKRETR